MEVYQANSVARQFRLMQQLITLRTAGNGPITKGTEGQRVYGVT